MLRAREGRARASGRRIWSGLVFTSEEWWIWGFYLEGVHIWRDSFRDGLNGARYVL